MCPRRFCCAPTRSSSEDIAVNERNHERKVPMRH
jgi:hypothetical protein